MKAVMSPDLVTHEYERGWQHNTRCGLQLEGHMVLDGSGVIDCVECIGGSSHISAVDLLHGTEVQIDLAPYDANGRVLAARPATMTLGSNQNDLVWNDLPNGVVVCGFVYLRKDGTELRSRSIEPIRVTAGNTLHIERGNLVLTR